ncbi:MAG: DNA helicase RecQ [bacterium]
MQQLLKKYWGYETFRPLQQEIIDHVLLGNDCFVLMPTGGGKSLCFQLPAVYLPGLTLVVSPLIALMKDQVDSLRANGIRAEYINSSLGSGEIAKIIENLNNKEIKLLYIAPERFALADFQEFLQSLDISLIAIDEAHCISEWGHDFRPDYRNLRILKKIFPGVPLMALTATATDKVRLDINEQLNLGQAKTYISSFDRANLTIKVLDKKLAFPKLLSILADYKKESVIIYCHSRKETEDLAANLRINGFKAKAYHAGLDQDKRKLAQELFINDKARIIVATIAFGMGIDKPNVRLVVHYTFPKSLEGYYQEIGRAGRDGLPSECIMFYTYADLRKHEFFINGLSDPMQAEQSREKLAQVLEFCDLRDCRKRFLLGYFGEEQKSHDCGSCDNCLSEKVYFDASIISLKIFSTVYKLEQSFGARQIIDILLGKKNQKVLQNRHDELSVYGIVNDFSEYELGQLISQLVSLGLLSKSDGKYPVISLTSRGIQFLRDKPSLELIKPNPDTKAGPIKTNGRDFNQALFEELRELRRQIAEEFSLPPFIIFGDTSLKEMAFYLPQDLESFGKIVGVGARKLEQFGDDFTRLIRNFATSNQLDSKEIVIASKAPIQVRMAIREPVYFSKTKELLLKKIPVARIAKNQKLTQITIINHIEKMLDAGEKIDLEYLKLPRDRYEAMKKAFKACSDEKLKPAFEYLKGKFNYDELRLARLLFRNE